MEPELLEIWGDEAKFSILIALKLFGALNLKNISKILSKPEPTTLRQLKILFSKGLIEIDQEESEKSWGKFYKISELANNYFSKSDELIHKISNQGNKVEMFQTFSSLIQSVSSFSFSISKFASQFIHENAKDLSESADEGNCSDAMIFMLKMIKLERKEDVIEYLAIIDDFQKKLEKFSIGDHNSEDWNQIIYVSSIPTKNIHPIKEKRTSSEIYKKIL